MKNKIMTFICKMKKKIIICLVIIVLISLTAIFPVVSIFVLYCCCTVVPYRSVNLIQSIIPDKITVREVRIKLLDSETNLPIPNVKIYNIIRMSVPDDLHFFGAFILMHFSESKYNISEYETDINGEVVIPETVIKGNASQFLDGQEIIINADVVERNLSDCKKNSYLSYNDYQKISDRLDKKEIFIPLQKYKIVHIFSCLGSTHHYSNSNWETNYIQKIENPHNLRIKLEEDILAGMIFRYKSFKCGPEILTVKLEKRS